MALPMYSECRDILTLSCAQLKPSYIAIASELQISVTNSYLCRPTNRHGHIVNKPFTSFSAEAHLKLYLKEAQMKEGKMLPSFRSGSAITLALSGSQLADIMSRVGWNNKKTALYYMKLAEVLRIDSPSYLLSADCSATSALTENYMEMNHPKNFVSYSQRSHLAHMKRDDRMNNAILSIQRSVVV